MCTTLTTYIIMRTSPHYKQYYVHKHSRYVLHNYVNSIVSAFRAGVLFKAVTICFFLEWPQGVIDSWGFAPDEGTGILAAIRENKLSLLRHSDLALLPRSLEQSARYTNMPKQLAIFARYGIGADDCGAGGAGYFKVSVCSSERTVSFAKEAGSKRKHWLACRVVVQH